MTQHKWHKEIKAWADGAEIEACCEGIWFSTDYPNWDVINEFRIKPQPKEKKYLYVYHENGAPLTIISYRFANHTGYEYLGKIEVQDD